MSTDLAPADQDEPPARSLAQPPGSAPRASVCAPYHDESLEGRRRGRNAMAIWQDLVGGHAFPGRYTSVRRYARRIRSGGGPAEPAGFIVTQPGEEAQVDYGVGPMVRDPAPAHPAGRATST